MSTAALPKVAPIKMYGIAGRYTNALYAAAANKSELLLVEADLKLFKETMATSAALRNFFYRPLDLAQQKGGRRRQPVHRGGCVREHKERSVCARRGRAHERDQKGHRHVRPAPVRRQGRADRRDHQR